MPLRDDLKNYIPKRIATDTDRTTGYVVGPEEYNDRWNLNRDQGNHNADTIEQLLDMLYETVLSDTDGALHIFINDAEFVATTVKAALLELAGRIASNLLEVQGNDTDIQANADNLTTHKSSADHDGRYYTETEIDAFEAAMQLLVNQNAASAVSLQSQISALDDIYSTDSERALAIANTIAAFELADDDLESLINGKANASDVYTKAQIDQMTLGAYKLDYNKKYYVLPVDASQFAVDVPGFNATNDVVMVHRGGRIMTEGVEFEIDVTDTYIVSLEGDWPAGTEFDYWIIKNIRVIDPGDYIDGAIIGTGSITRDKLAAAVQTELDNLRSDIASNDVDIQLNTILANSKATVLYGTGTIPTTGWVDASGFSDYAWSRWITVVEVVNTDWIDIVIDQGSHDTAGDAEISPTVVEGTGGFTMYANTVPTAVIPFKWKVVR